MSARTEGGTDGGAGRAADPRVMRTRAAVAAAATRLFLENRYDGTTMEDIAAAAGLTKRTLYNNYADKEALFRETVTDVIARAETFAREVPTMLSAGVTVDTLPGLLREVGRTLGRTATRPEVVGLRRLLVGSFGAFPELAGEYYARAPGGVIDALAGVFEELAAAGLLRAADPRRAAEQFGYLVLGAALDRALLTGEAPSEEAIDAAASEAVDTFLARYADRPAAADVMREVVVAMRNDVRVRGIAATRKYAGGPDEVWRAITDPARLAEWFGVVTGELRQGGRYAIEKNASGEVTECAPPHRLALTWEWEGQVSWLTVRLTEAPGGAVLRLEHTSPLQEPDEFWDAYGPGGGGVGWDQALYGLERYLAGAPMPTPEEAQAWTSSDAGRAFIGTCSDAWAAAAITAGADAQAARDAAARTTAIYTGVEAS